MIGEGVVKQITVRLLSSVGSISENGISACDISSNFNKYNYEGNRRSERGVGGREREGERERERGRERGRERFRLQMI